MIFWRESFGLESPQNGHSRLGDQAADSVRPKQKNFPVASLAFNRNCVNLNDQNRAMSTKITIQYHDEEGARFSLYRECFDEPIEFIYLELGGVPFEAESSSDLCGKGRSHLTVRVPVKWAAELIIGFQKAQVEAFVPIEVRNRARDVFDSEEAATSWLFAKPIVFGGKSAVELCRDGRADLVLYELGIIEGECWA